VGQRPADRPPVAHLVVADLGRHRAQRVALRGEQLACLEIAMAGERSYREVIIGVAHVRELAHSFDVDEHRRSGEPQLHQRQERHAAGQELGVVPVLGQRGGGLVD
jgi:hypothetical protein